MPRNGNLEPRQINKPTFERINSKIKRKTISENKYRIDKMVYLCVSFR